MIHCGGPDCEVHQHVGADTMRHERLPVGWVKVFWYGSGNGDSVDAFCGLGCVMKWAATFPPSERIPLFDPPEPDDE